MAKPPKGSRFTHPADYTGERSRGRAVGTIWWSETAGSGDVTLRDEADTYMSPAELHDMLDDAIGMLERELEVLVERFPGLAILPDAARAREILHRRSRERKLSNLGLITKPAEGSA